MPITLLPAMEISEHPRTAPTEERAGRVPGSRQSSNVAVADDGRVKDDAESLRFPQRLVGLHLGWPSDLGMESVTESVVIHGSGFTPSLLGSLGNLL